MQPRHIQPSAANSPRPAAPTGRTEDRASQKPAPKPAERAAPKPAERTIEFFLEMPGAKAVAIAGSFNGWDQKRSPMRKDGDGGWRTSLSLGPGRYEYRFVADGRWLSDPKAKESVANGYGDTNSVLMV